MIIRFEGAPCKILHCKHVPGHGKDKGSVVTYLVNLVTGSSRRQRLDPIEFEEVSGETQAFSYLYKDETLCWLMNSQTFEQVGITKSLFGKRETFLEEGIILKVSFVDGQPYRVAFNKIIDAVVSFTLPPDHYISSHKYAVLDNGVRVTVPLVIQSGDTIRLYIDLLRAI